MFTNQEINFMKKLGFDYDFDNLSDNELVEIEDRVGDQLVLHELDESYNPTDAGKICESILSKIP